MRLLFERDLTPHPQYAAFYQWLQRPAAGGGFDAHAILHLGMHGTVEWLPGAPLGNTGLSWPDVLLGALPNVYVYAANNPSESIVAKRRGYGVLVSYNVPPYGRAGLYKELSSLSALLSDWREDPASSGALLEPIASLAISCGLTADCPPPVAGGEVSVDSIAGLPATDFAAWAGDLATTLRTTEARLFSSGLHTLGAAPDAAETAAYLGAYFGDRLTEASVAAIAAGGGVEAGRAATTGGGGGGAPLDTALLAEAADIAGLLSRTPDEIAGVLTALDGGYVPAAPGGDLLRDGPGVLPTGRNIHALDPYRMPSAAAVARGSATADAILAAHLASHAGTYPETVAVNLWGLDAIKTRGESVATVLHLVGAVPVSEGTGRVGRFELLPLSALTPPGRPRIDVLCNMSGIFRDTYANVVDLLDDLFARAAAAPGEPPSSNYIKKHAAEIQAAAGGDDAADVRASSRLFCNPPGDYGSMVGERIGAGNWESGGELGDTWAARNAFSYGKGGERGAARPDVLAALLSTTDRVVQTVDSVEYGLTDIQEYFANTGALARAAADARARAGRVAGGPAGSSPIVPVSIVEAVGDAPPRDLDTVLRLEYRTKLLNPRWAAAMVAQGSGGAFEISQRMTAAVGWGGTTGFKADWVWEQAVETYVLDGEVANALKKSNPEAFRNVVKRALEAAGRGLWENPDAEMLAALKQAYSDVDDQLEGVGSGR
jgi:magnesium chelatase subunit H